MSLLQKILIGIVQGYRWFLSPWLGSACRFTPTCSAYALEALRQYGAAHGSYLSARRLMRCHPWCAGGHDPVPPTGKTHLLFTSLISPASPEKTFP